MYALVTVVDREIDIEIFNTEKEAFEKMEKELMNVVEAHELKKEEDYDIYKTSAWANESFNSENQWDWSIFNLDNK